MESPSIRHLSYAPISGTVGTNLLQWAKLKDLFLKHTSAARDANGVNFSPLTSDEADKLYSIFKSYRASAKDIDNLKDALRAFEGTHCFHNYTRGRDYDNKSSSRYIISFEVQDPIISEHDGMEWIPTHVTGQSFLLNQIRKMISMAIDVARQFVFKEASTDVEHGCNDIIQDSFLKKKRCKLMSRLHKVCFLK